MYKHIHLIYYKGAKAIQWEKKVYSPNAAGTTGYAHEKKMNIDSYHASYTKINSTWIIKARTIKLLGKKKSEYIADLGVSKEILDRTQISKYILNDQLNFINI